MRGLEGPPILLIHGFGGNLDSWTYNRAALAAAFRVISLDLPGHGESEDTGGATAEALAETVLGLMDALVIESAHLVAHSMGGAVALAVAARRPHRLRSLTLIASTGLGPEIDAAYIAGFVAAKRRRDLREVVAKLFADKSLVSDRMLEEIIRMKRIDGVEAALARMAAAHFPGGAQVATGHRETLARLRDSLSDHLGRRGRDHPVRPCGGPGQCQHPSGRRPYAAYGAMGRGESADRGFRPGPMMELGMSLPQPLHCMMEVKDLARSITFYEKLLGFQVVERHLYPGHVLAFMRSRRSPFELELDQPLAWGRRRQQRIRTWHIGYGVKDIAAEHARLTKLGFRAGARRGLPAEREVHEPLVLPLRPRRLSDRVRGAGRALRRPRTAAEGEGVGVTADA